MSKFENDYLDLLEKIRIHGVEQNNRTNIPCKQIFGHMLEVELSEGFPMLTTKKVNFEAICHELIWFLSGSDNIKYLQDNNVHIWDFWADSNGSVGPMYGVQWCKWNGNINQLDSVIKEIKQDPTSRRLLISAWNTSFIPDNKTMPNENPPQGLMSLAPCHILYQFCVDTSSLELSCLFFMRSTDVFLGLPFNIASYALLTHIIAKECNLKPGKLIFSGGNVHIYNNHIEQVEKQLSRRDQQYALPSVSFDYKNIYSYRANDFNLQDYKHHEALKAPIAV